MRTSCSALHHQHGSPDGPPIGDLWIPDYSPEIMDCAGPVDKCVGNVFEIELHIPWDAQEELADINSTDVIPLGSLPDVVGLCDRQPGTAASRILQGRDSRSIRFLVPDSPWRDSELS